MIDKVINGDSLEYIKRVDRESCDLIILDPDYQDWKKILKTSFMSDCFSALKKSGNILCFTKQPFDYDLRVAVNDWFRREIVWTFVNGNGWVSNRMPLVSTQKIYWLTKSSEFYFHPRTGMPYSEGTKDHKRKNKVFEGYEAPGKLFEKSTEGVWIRDHLHINKPHSGPIPEKPEDLMRILIRCFSPSNGRILDLFSGSGVVGRITRCTDHSVVCAEINRSRARNIADSVGVDVSEYNELPYVV